MKCFAIMAAIGLLSGCTHTQPGTVTKGKSDSELVRLISIEVPTGTSVSDAMSFMKSEGFECTVERDSVFIIDPYGDTTRKEARIEGADFIRCSRQEPESMLVTKFTSVALILSDGVVTDVRVTEQFTGP